MSAENYLIIENNIVTNVVLWDGNTASWQPPINSTALLQETTPAMVWTIPTETTDSVLEEIIGAGWIEFTWDGKVLTTNAPKPIYIPPPSQPVSTGTKTA